MCCVGLAALVRGSSGCLHNQASMGQFLASTYTSGIALTQYLSGANDSMANYVCVDVKLILQFCCANTRNTECNSWCSTTHVPRVHYFWRFPCGSTPGHAGSRTSTTTGYRILLFVPGRGNPARGRCSRGLYARCRWELRSAAVASLGRFCVGNCLALSHFALLPR